MEHLRKRERDFLPMTVLSLSLNFNRGGEGSMETGTYSSGKKSLNSAPARTAAMLEGNSREASPPGLQEEAQRPGQRGGEVRP